ncbi:MULTISPECIES: hypothetical protein [Nitrosomonas]|uniref:hypothetical protein n=1 Tax=Nitrosomonas TaxID=914 RepID=UPI00069BBC56|nr:MULTISPECIES: hypothetical protein [Nitrosomonas]UVS60010.1 hypothetical protein NX761_10690 [Nitrosomonas sp. PLL12]
MQHVTAVTDMACRLALAERGVAHINFPIDLQEAALKDDDPDDENTGAHFCRLDESRSSSFIRRDKTRGFGSE